MKRNSSERPSFLPKYAWVRQQIADKIHSGLLKPGSRVPSEAEIMKEYNDE